MDDFFGTALDIIIAECDKFDEEAKKDHDQKLKSVNQYCSEGHKLLRK